MSQAEKISDAISDLKYGHPEARKKAAIKLGRIRDKTVIPALIEAMKTDQYVWTRVSAIQSLTWIADPEIIDPLIEVAHQDPEKLVRKTAIEALGNMGDPKALPKLEAMLHEEGLDDELREVIAHAIEKLQNPT